MISPRTIVSLFGQKTAETVKDKKLMGEAARNDFTVLHRIRDKDRSEMQIRSTIVANYNYDSTINLRHR